MAIYPAGSRRDPGLEDPYEQEFRRLREMIDNPQYSESVREMLRGDAARMQRRNDPYRHESDAGRAMREERSAMGLREKRTFESGLDATSSGQLAMLRNELRGGQGISGHLVRGRGNVSMTQLLAEAGLNVSPSQAQAAGKRIPKYARGGIARRPQLAVIGENEPEAVIPERILSDYGGEDLLARLGGGLLSDEPDEGGMLSEEPDLDAEYENEINAMLDASGERGQFMGHLEEERPKGFWEGVAAGLGPQPTSGNVSMKGNPLGVLAAMAGVFANLQTGKAAREMGRRTVRNKERVDMARETQRQASAMDRGVRMERLRRLGTARQYDTNRRNKLADEGAQYERETIEIPGQGRFPKTTNLAQSYVSQRTGIPLRAEKTAEDARPSPVVSSMGEDEAKREYDNLVDSARRNYWEKRFGNSPESFAMYSRSDMPESEMAKVQSDPQVVRARNKWRSSAVIRKARNARSVEDLQDIQADLESLPPEVDNDPRVMSAIQDAVNRVK